MRIIIGAVISLPPFSPGIAWDWMQLAVGLHKLGHDVYYIEEVEPRWCVDASGRQCALERSLNRALFRATMSHFDLLDRAYQIRRGEESGIDGSLRALLSLRPDLLINMAGHVQSDFVLQTVERRAYFDQDPVYTQLWYAEYGKELNFSKHDVFLSVGLNIGTPYSCIPDCGVEWHHVLPAVVMEHWPPRIDSSSHRFTTVASWASYSDLNYRGVWYGSKYEEFRRFAELPRRVDQDFEVALRRHREEDAGVRQLRDNGWLVSAATEIATLASYQDFIAQSRAEIGIAKNAYVQARSGWFSDRAAHYLASGKPVLAQSTGFERCLPTGRGLLTFQSMEEAAAGVEDINRDYLAHCRAAREFAAEYLDYRRVLPRMLNLCTA